MPSSRRAVALLVGALGLAAVLPAAAQAPNPTAAHPRYLGRALEEALLELRQRGLKVLFSSNLVRAEMTVEVEPTATTPHGILEELLAPHGLTAREGPNETLVVVRRASRDGAPPPTGDAAAAEADDAPAMVLREELVVTPSRISLLREEPTGPLSLDREDILELPHLGDDFFRALTLLPGTTANDVTAQFHVRGSRRDETVVLLDGQELFEPFHLQDFDSASSFVAPAVLSGAELTTGGFAARYGDRMSGVLDMTTVIPAGEPRGRLGAGILGAQAGGGGPFAARRGSWLVELRRGTSDLLGRLLGDEDPHYWDAFGKTSYQLHPRHGLQANLLRSADELDFEEVRSDEHKRFETEYESAYLWLTHHALLGRDLLLESAASHVRVERDRRGLEVEEAVRFAILDQRDADISEARQTWLLQASPGHLLSWGGRLRWFDARYDYFGEREFDDPLAQIRHDFGQESTAFAGDFEERDAALFASDRVRLWPALTAELGLRYDRQTHLDERHASPRLNLAYGLGERSVVRLAWGEFTQSQRPHELQVEDGETSFHPLERAEHRVLSFERVFAMRRQPGGLALRAELYRRSVEEPRRRYENLFEPINVFPEVEPDRVLIAPRRSLAEGAELFLRGGLGRRGTWWLNYAYASSEDSIDGRWVPRLFDQRHSINVDLDLRLREHWRLNLAWRYHSGWPTTPLTLGTVEDEEGETRFVPVLGPLNSERLPVYHRLDLRASRRWQLDRTAVDLFVDVQNLYDRANLAGFDFEIDEEEGTLTVDEEEWPGLIPSAGISVEF